MTLGLEKTDSNCLFNIVACWVGSVYVDPSDFRGDIMTLVHHIMTFVHHIMTLLHHIMAFVHHIMTFMDHETALAFHK